MLACCWGTGCATDDSLEAGRATAALTEPAPLCWGDAIDAVYEANCKSGKASAECDAVAKLIGEAPPPDAIATPVADDKSCPTDSYYKDGGRRTIGNVKYSEVGCTTECYDYCVTLFGVSFCGRVCNRVCGAS